ncbi:MAG TPA: hypothetical protein PLB62_05460, partial [Candidatus Sumerlaeota bacterium]|nr:hypothetical protein [Candidatus Sumerlaeota bacterium]
LRGVRNHEYGWHLHGPALKKILTSLQPCNDDLNIVERQEMQQESWKRQNSFNPGGMSDEWALSRSGHLRILMFDIKGCFDYSLPGILSDAAKPHKRWN